MSRGLAKAATVIGLTLVLSVVLGALAPAARADWAPRRDLMTWMNAARNDRGAVDLHRVWVLRQLADQHSRDMAREDRIFHTTNLGYELRIVSWRIAGENVGVSDDLRAMFQAFMKSDPHRDNILGSSFRRVGVGVFNEDGVLWVTLIFVG